MLAVLAEVEDVLPALLQDERVWQSLYVDYHPPTVERLWAAWGDYRVSLHRIHPCEREQALFHPHPWPSAMRVLEGDYEMAVGFGAGSETPPVAALMIVRGDFRYEMTHPDSWHYVRPLGRPTLSVMVTGKPWARDAPKSSRPLRPLRPEQVAELLRLFRGRYPGDAR
jgi:hypothetical protein